MRWLPALALALPACAPPPPAECAAPTALAFHADLPSAGDEAYLCFGFDAAPLAARALRSLSVEAPAAAPLVYHHVALYAVSGAFPDGPVPCEGMPAGAVELDVWAPGGGPLALPDGVGLLVPPGTQRLVVQTHVLRTASGPAATGALHLCVDDGVQHLATWLPARAPVPAIRPHTVESSTAECRVSAPLHVVSTWPHMHRAGAAFHGAVLRVDGARAPLVDVEPWVFDPQRPYVVDAELATGDAIETTCVWRNDSDSYVLPGPLVSDEMCGQSLIAWPSEAARCAP
jgi:hypothetical protein